MLVIFVTLYGTIGALSALLQVRRMLATRSSDDISIAFLLIYLGGYLVWLVYGLVGGDLPLIIVDLVGLGVSSLTLLVALRLRMSERGQDLLAALRDERDSRPERLRWLAPEAKKKDIPKVLAQVGFNRLYPLRLGLAFEKASDNSPLERLLVRNARSWRRLELEAGPEVYRSWRNQLAESLERLPESWRDRPLSEVARRELLRPEQARPVTARLGACRAVSLAAVAADIPDEQLGRLCLAQIGRMGSDISFSEMHWAEQLLAAVTIKGRLLGAEEEEMVVAILAKYEAMGMGTLRVPYTVASESLEWLLWPVAGQAGDNYATADPLLHLPLRANWFFDNNTALARVLALALRRRDYRRLATTHPLDRSLAEGAASLMASHLDFSPNQLARLYPLERALVVALGQGEECLPDLARVDVADTANFFARRCGRAEDEIAAGVERHFLSVAQRGLAVQQINSQQDLAAFDRRLVFLWRDALGC